LPHAAAADAALPGMPSSLSDQSLMVR
jgi:hypothetical protein